MNCDIKREVTINEEQRLYVIPTGYGYTCLGFDVCERRRKALAIELLDLGRNPPACGGVGTMGNYDAYAETRALALNVHKEMGYRFTCELHPKLIGLEGKRVEVTYADGRTARFKVGRSTGWIPIHLRIHNARSLGGMAVDVSEVFNSVRVIS